MQEGKLIRLSPFITRKKLKDYFKQSIFDYNVFFYQKKIGFDLPIDFESNEKYFGHTLIDVLCGMHIFLCFEVTKGNERKIFNIPLCFIHPRVRSILGVLCRFATSENKIKFYVKTKSGMFEETIEVLSWKTKRCEMCGEKLTPRGRSRNRKSNVCKSCQLKKRWKKKKKSGGNTT